MTGASFTYELTAEKQEILLGLMANGNYRKREVPYSLFSVEGESFNATLYEKEKHGTRKLCVQGRGAKEFIEFVLEPHGVVPLSALTSEDEVAMKPHGGSDESGKGDYFGPLVVACAYVDAEIAEKVKTFRYQGADGRSLPLPVMDCKAYTATKTLSADQKILMVDERLRTLLGPRRYVIVKRSPANYNRKYSRFKNVNALLAQAHAEGIESFLDKNPIIGRIVVDQFAPTEWTVNRALGEFGRRIEIDQHHKAESDLAVAIASVLARAAFIRDMDALAREIFGVDADGRAKESMPMGSSDPRVRLVAEAMVRKFGPVSIMNHCKAHFRTTDQVLAACGLDRTALPEEGRVVSASHLSTSQQP